MLVLSAATSSTVSGPSRSALASVRAKVMRPVAMRPGDDDVRGDAVLAHFAGRGCLDQPTSERQKAAFETLPRLGMGATTPEGAGDDAAPMAGSHIG